MPEPIDTPEHIRAQLLEDAVRTPWPTLGKAERGLVVKLHADCNDILARLRGASSDVVFPNIFFQVKDVEDAAGRLEFWKPPVQRLQYNRGMSTAGIAQRFCSPPHFLLLIPAMHPDLIRASGYRFQDPDCGENREFIVVGQAEQDEPGKPRVFDPWANVSKLDDRIKACELLERWVRKLSKIIPSLSPDKEPKTKATPPGPAGAEQAAVSKQAAALGVLSDHPEWSDKKIAEMVSCHPKTLYRWKRYRLARNVLRSGRAKFLPQKNSSADEGDDDGG